MSDNLVKRLRDWQHVHPEDQDKPEGHLYEEAADRIEALEAENARLEDAFQLYVDANERVLELESKLVRYHEVVGDKINLRAEIAELKSENKLLRGVVAEAVNAFDAIKRYSIDGDARRKAIETIAKLTRGGGEECDVRNV